jgi:hypothetical protein
MKLELKLDLLLSAVIVGFLIPAWLPIAWGGNSSPNRWKPLVLVTTSLLLELLFVNLITFGPLTLDYSLRFAAVGVPTSILALVLALKMDRNAAPRGLFVSSGLSLLMWFFLITMH